jgi:hypothetical protein
LEIQTLIAAESYYVHNHFNYPFLGLVCEIFGFKCYATALLYFKFIGGTHFETAVDLSNINYLLGYIYVMHK